MNKFWNFIKTDGEDRTLFLDDAISDETWWGDEVTPKLFKDELTAGSGNITVWINSPGGDVFAAAQIYNMLKEYSGKVTVKIDGIAASAASVVAMSGNEVLMSPVANMMIHNPATIAIGDSEEMLRAKRMLDEVKESIINAYQIKTKQSRDFLSEMMNTEFWMDAHKAVELGFADGILYEDNQPQKNQKSREGYAFSRMSVMNSLLERFTTSPSKPTGAVPYTILNTRIQSIKKMGGFDDHE